MMMTETKARADEGLPLAHHPGAEVKSAMAGFLNAFNGFQDEVKQTLQQQEERLTMLDRKTMTYARAPLSAHAELEVPHKKAFGAYLRTGDDDGLRGLQLEGKAMSSAVNADGGYLLDPQTADSIRSMLVSTSSLRSIANVVQIDATSFDVLIDRSEVGSGWATEVAATAETATPTIERISIKLSELSAMPKASQRLLDDSAFDVEGWLAGKIATRLSGPRLRPLSTVMAWTSRRGFCCPRRWRMRLGPGVALAIFLPAPPRTSRRPTRWIA